MEHCQPRCCVISQGYVRYVGWGRGAPDRTRYDGSCNLTTPHQPSVEVKQAVVEGKPRSPKPLQAIQGYGLAVLTVSMALGGALFMQRFHVRNVEIPFFLFALALSPGYGGSGPPVLALGRSPLSFAYFFTEPFPPAVHSVSPPPCFLCLRPAG